MAKIPEVQPYINTPLDIPTQPQTNSTMHTEQQPFANGESPLRALLVMLGTLLMTIALILFVPVRLVEQLGSFGYVGVFLITLLANATIVIPSPALAAAFIAGATLNPWLVGVVSGVAAALGETTGYLMGRGGSTFTRHTRLYQRVEQWVQQWGALTIFVLAVIPSPLLDIGGIAAGVLRMPFRTFLLACMAGKIVRFIGVAWIGYWFGNI